MKSQTYLNKIKSFFKKNAGKEVTRYQMIQYVLESEKWEKARKTTCIVDSVTSKLQYEGYIDKGQNGKWIILKEIPESLTSTQINSFKFTL